MARYSDLHNAFGKDYQRAVEHYLTFGLKENRLGYLEGGYGNRWTVSDPSHGLFVSASRRMGGAIDSLVWNNHEFINAWDHGRELQMAMNFVPHGEAFNPTEGGGRTDSQADSTKTVIRHIHAAGKTLTSEAPTGYMPSEFTVFRSVHLTSGQLVTYTNTHPVVASTADDRYAMGVFAPAGQDTDLFQYYGVFHFGSNPDSPSDDQQKWKSSTFYL
ncbi:hypothetical protein C0Q70_18978 [Pomacea canaliculata]|uniref:Uncharacterized protein n=1 Tax=Pomacea canaliculata TaxID=400727 RepID=A0A2T7NI09_POMCA|nr:hypothetical protein C0Q70_18978 [Pomacea canaliculata]